MMAPWYDVGATSWQGLAVAIAIGAVFGWFLERGGLGNARKLAGQFYLTDMTVLKVMFSAIVTAMLGLFWLSWAGVLDLSRVYVPETFILPQILGGVVFGAGFALAGLCPGTSCVSAATGRRDGIAVLVGMLAGVFVFAEAFSLVRGLYESTSRGPLTLPQALGISHGAAAFAVVGMAIGAFRIAGWLEQRARAADT